MQTAKNYIERLLLPNEERNLQDTTRPDSPTNGRKLYTNQEGEQSDWVTNRMPVLSSKFLVFFLLSCRYSVSVLVILLLGPELSSSDTSVCLGLVLVGNLLSLNMISSFVNGVSTKQISAAGGPSASRI